MLELAQQLSYYLSVVDGGATSKLVSFGQQLASIGIIAQSASASIRGMVAPFQQVAQAWSGREQQINNIARSLRQYEVVGQSIADINDRINRSMSGAPLAERAAAQSAAYRQQFGEARTFARGIIRQMAQDAAILPGEMNDYAQTFAMVYPAAMATASRRVHGHMESRTIGEILRTSNYLTAGAISAGIDAPQASRDIMGMLQGVAGLDNRTWRELVKNYAQLNGRRITDASQFNRLRGDQRFAVLQDVSNRLQPLMDATGDSFDAIMGTFTSLKHELYLSITEPVYNAWKNVINATTGQMARLQPQIQRIGDMLMTPVTKALEKLVSVMPKIGDRLEAWLGSVPIKLENMRVGAYRLAYQARGMADGVLTRFFGSHPAFASHSTHVNADLAKLVGRPTAVFIEQIGHGIKSALIYALPLILLRSVGVALGPVGFLVANLLTRVFTLSGGAGSFGSVTQLFSELFSVLAPVIFMFDGFMNMLAIGIAAILPMFFSFLSMISGVISGVLLPIMQLFQLAFMGALTLIIPALFLFAVGINVIYRALSALMRIILIMLGMDESLTGINLDITNFAETIRQMTTNAKNWWNELGESIEYLKMELHLISAADFTRTTRSNRERDYLSNQLDELDRANREIANRVSTYDPNRRGRPENNRPQVHQDFRYSRFDITQKFAEGFSPERVGAAFTSDLEAMANQRLSSGLAPAFTSG